MSEIRNLLPNPWPNGTSKWRQFNGTAQDCEMRMSNDESSMYFRGLTNTKCSWSCKVLDTPTGQMVFGLTTGTAGGMKARVKNLFSVELTEQKLLAQSNSFYLLPFEVTCSRHLNDWRRSEVGASRSSQVVLPVSTSYPRAPHGSRLFSYYSIKEWC